MAGKRLVNIDGMKLKKILTYKGLTLAEVSKALGYDASIISRSCTRNSMNRAAIAGLESRFGIKPEDYAPTKKEEEKPKPEDVESPQPMVLEIDYQKLFAVIYKAVREALEA